MVILLTTLNIGILGQLRVTLLQDLDNWESKKLTFLLVDLLAPG